MLIIFGPKYKDAKDFFENHLNPVMLVLIRMLSLRTQMSSHVPGFKSFFRFFESFCIGKISHQLHKG